jgi:adhesin transport system outer membrane protein
MAVAVFCFPPCIQAQQSSAEGEDTEEAGKKEETGEVESGQESLEMRKARIRVSDYLEPLMENSPRIREARGRADVAWWLMRRSRAGYFPRLDLISRFGYESISGPEEFSHEEWVNMQGLKATQLVFDFGYTMGVYERLKMDWEEARHDLELVRQQVLLNGITTYLDLVRAHDKLTFARLTESSIKQIVEQEESLVRRGAGVTSNVLQARSQLIGVEATRLAAEAEMENARSRFLAVFNVLVSEKDVARFTKPDVPVAHYPADLREGVTAALNENPRILMAKKRIESARSQVTVARSRFFPRIELVGEAVRMQNMQGLPDERTELTGMSVLEWNLFNGTSDLDGYRAARMTLTEKQRRLLYEQRLVEEKMRVSWDSLVTSRRVAEELDRQALILERFLELARKERRMGNRSLIDVLSGEINYINATSTAVAARTDYLVAAYDLLFAMGRLQLDNIVN